MAGSGFLQFPTLFNFRLFIWIAVHPCLNVPPSNHVPCDEASLISQLLRAVVEDAPLRVKQPLLRAVGYLPHVAGD